MPKVSVTVPHELPVQEVKAKAEAMIEKSVKDFEGRDLEVVWEESNASFSFKSLAFTIKGALEIEPQAVRVDIELPFAAMMFKDRVEKAITKNLTRAVQQSEG